MSKVSITAQSLAVLKTHAMRPMMWLACLLVGFGCFVLLTDSKSAQLRDAYPSPFDRSGAGVLRDGETFLRWASDGSVHPEITAIVTPQDSAVAGILKAIAAHGLRIPDDISVVGLLDESIAEVTTPPLTALSFSSRELGFTAADLLVARLDGSANGPSQVLVRSELCVRGSTGPAPTRS